MSRSTTLVSIPLDQLAVGSAQERSGGESSRRLRLLLDAAPESRRIAAVRGCRGAIRRCRGTAPSCGLPTSPTPARWSTRSWLPAARTNRFISRAGRRTARCTSPAIAPDGGCCIRCDVRRATCEVQPVAWQPIDEAEFGRPQWLFGWATWAFADERRMVATYAHRGRWTLATIDTEAGTLTNVPTGLEPLEWLTATPTHAVYVGRIARHAAGCRAHEPRDGRPDDAALVIDADARSALTSRCPRRSSFQPKAASRRTPSTTRRATPSSPRLPTSVRR